MTAVLTLTHHPHGRALHLLTYAIDQTCSTRGTRDNNIPRAARRRRSFFSGSNWCVIFAVDKKCLRHLLDFAMYVCPALQTS